MNLEVYQGKIIEVAEEGGYGLIQVQDYGPNLFIYYFGTCKLKAGLDVRFSIVKKQEIHGLKNQSLAINVIKYDRFGGGGGIDPHGQGRVRGSSTRLLFNGENAKQTESYKLDVGEHHYRENDGDSWTEIKERPRTVLSNIKFEQDSEITYAIEEGVGKNPHKI